MSRYGDSSLMSGLGRRKRRVRRGRGLWDTIKNIGSAALPALGGIAKDLAVGYLKKRIGLGKRRKRVNRRKTGRGILSDLVGSFGLGRKRRVRRKVGGSMMTGCKKRRVHRRTGHGILL